jgi:tetratricopeptide (TPR) repeat protein
LGLARLGEIVNRQGARPEELRAQFQNILAETIGNAQQANSLNPVDALNSMNLGRVYEAILPFRIQGAADFAKKYYSDALERFPSNPEPYLAQARVEILEGRTTEAKNLLLKAVELKSDYAPAHFLLAQLEAQAGNISAAIKSAETTALLAPNDIGALFQLGLLYYQNKNFSDARLVLERAVSINSNYSNARYFLGLIYAREGEKQRALQEFEQILALNPGHQEVLRIIQNLRQGLDPLSGISPPQPQPERRSQLPVAP